MTKDEALEAAKVLQAYAEEKKIQYKHKKDANRTWIDCLSIPDFNFEFYDYRIKPELPM